MNPVLDEDAVELLLHGIVRRREVVEVFGELVVGTNRPAHLSGANRLQAPGRQQLSERRIRMIEVVLDRTENGETTQTIRLVTCAPLAVGVISEGGSPRNDAPELERIPLGSAAATIAGLACGAMN